MHSIEFALLAAENYSIFLGFLILSIFIHIFLIRHFAIGLLDPIVTAIIGNIFAFATALFVFYVDDSSREYIFSFFTAELAFWAGFIMLAPSGASIVILLAKIKPIPVLPKREFPFLVLWLMFIFLKVMQFTFVGIPLFAFVRIGMATDSGGLGVFQTSASLIFPLLIYYATFLYIAGRLNRIRGYLFIITMIAMILLDGSKSTFIPLAQSVFIYAIVLGGRDTFNKSNIFINKNISILIVIAISMTIGTIFFKENDISESIALLGRRLLAFGDAYYLGYPNGVIESLDQTKYLEVLFYPTLSTLRLIDFNKVSESLGVMLAQSVHNNFEGGGPNARHNILGLYLFGEIGFVFSFIIGMLIGVMRRLLLIFSGGFYSRYLCAFILISASVFFTDAPLGIYVTALGLIFLASWVILAKAINQGCTRRYFVGKTKSVSKAMLF
jgi:hypothetical protein